MLMKTMFRQYQELRGFWMMTGSQKNRKIFFVSNFPQNSENFINRFLFFFLDKTKAFQMNMLTFIQDNFKLYSFHQINSPKL